MSFVKPYWLWYFCSFIVVVFLSYSIFTLLKSNALDNSQEKKTTTNYNLSNLKSPCRELTKKDLFLKIEKEGEIVKPRSSMKKINTLMSNPIDWMVQSTDGQVLDLYCYRNKKVFINLWATWCPPCIEELPSLSDFAEKNSQQILVIAVTTEPLKTVTRFIDKSFSDLSKNLKIVQISPEELEHYFPTASLPATYIFNKKGLLEERILGAYDWLQYSLK